MPSEFEYVVATAMLYCDKGCQNVNLRLPADRRIYSGPFFVANKSDFNCDASDENIGSFGVCTGLHTDCPADKILTPWLECKDDVIVAGHPAVLETSEMMCATGGGRIIIVFSGQRPR